MNKYFILLLSLFILVSCKPKEPSIYELFAEQYLNDPGKYEFIEADTLDFWELLSLDDQLGAQYANFETSIQRAFDLMELEVSIRNLEQDIHLADSLLNLKSDIVFQGKTQNQLELQAQFEGTQNRIKIEKSRFESLIKPYGLGNSNIIWIRHKYRTINKSGNLIIEESSLSVDTVLHELVYVKTTE
jgi:hypothetical protein